MANTNNLTKGQFLEVDGIVYQVVDFQHVKPGKGQAFVRILLKNVETGRVIDKKFRAGENVPDADVERRDAQYLYKDEDGYYFMDTNSFEQFSLSKEDLGNAIYYLKEEMEVLLLFHKNRCIGIELPTTVDLEVIETEPGIKGNTVSGGSKPAKLETGLVVQVPLFVNKGDVVKVDTRTGEYVSRA